MTCFEGQLKGEGMRLALVASRFNDFIVTRLVDGASDALRRHGVSDSDVDIAWVPGALELPLVVSRLAASGHYDAVIALGAVIRGATGHYDVVVGQTAAGLMRAQLDTGVPVIVGVLTTDTIEQAIERAGTKAGNKGAEAAAAAVEVVNLLKAIPVP